MATTFGPAWFNIPVEDVDKTRQFYKALGFKLNGRRQSAELVSFLVGANEMVVHFFRRKVFEQSTKGKAANAKKGSELMITIGSKTKQQINSVAKKVKAAGGKVFIEPSESPEGYYGCAFSDPDGHKWNLLLIE